MQHKAITMSSLTRHAPLHSLTPPHPCPSCVPVHEVHCVLCCTDGPGQLVEVPGGHVVRHIGPAHCVGLQGVYGGNHCLFAQRHGSHVHLSAEAAAAAARCSQKPNEKSKASCSTSLSCQAPHRLLETVHSPSTRTSDSSLQLTLIMMTLAFFTALALCHSILCVVVQSSLQSASALSPVKESLTSVPHLWLNVPSL